MSEMAFAKCSEISISSTVLHIVLVAYLLPSSIVSARRVKDTKIDKELILTYNEKVVFDTVKGKLYPYLTEEWMKNDLFILRWVRAKDLNVARAEREAFELLDFLKVNNMSTILTEDWSDMHVAHPYYSDIVDLLGRPVTYFSMSNAWDVRRTILEGKHPRLVRYMYKLGFELYMRTFEISKTQPNVTQFSILVNFDGFNVFQQGCPSCVSVYFTLLETYERFFPGYAHEIILFNAPSGANVLLEVLRPVFSKGTMKALKVLGTNRRKWKPFLDARIDPHVLPYEYGGNRPEK